MYRLISCARYDITRPALDKARWRCQKCKGESNLRVIEHVGVIRVLCDLCRVRLGSPVP